MTYDLELRLPDDAPDAVGTLRALAAGNGAVPEGEDRWSVRLEPSGLARLQLHAPTGSPPYLSCGLELGAPPAELEALLQRLVPLAREANAKLTDPQLGRTVSIHDAAAIERRYTEAAEYAVRWTGLASDPRGFGAEAVIPRASSTVPGRTLLAFLALAAVGLFLGDALFAFFVPQPTRPTYYEPAPGEPAAWWQLPDATTEPPLEALPLAVAARLREEQRARAALEATDAIELDLEAAERAAREATEAAAEAARAAQ